MRLIQITVSYRATATSSEVSVTPGVSLTAALDVGDDPATVQAALLAEAKALIDGEVDAVLDLDAYSPGPWNEPLFTVVTVDVHISDEHAYVIVPASTTIDTNGMYWTYTNSTPMRRRAALQNARKRANGAPVFDCSDGDLTPLYTFLGERVINHERATNAALWLTLGIEDDV